MRNMVLSASTRELKTKIEKLIRFQDGKRLMWRAEDESVRKQQLRSKYRKVMTCSFTNGPGRIISVEGMASKKSQL